MTDRLSSVPQFTIAGVTFTCWITDDGQVYEWRDDTGRARIRRNIGSGRQSAMVDGKVVGSNFKTGSESMAAAVAVMK